MRNINISLDFETCTVAGEEIYLLDIDIEELWYLTSRSFDLDENCVDVNCVDDDDGDDDYDTRYENGWYPGCDF